MQAIHIIYNDREPVCSKERLVCGKQKDRGSIPASETLLSLQKLWFMDTGCLELFVTLPRTINELLKWLTSLPVLMQKSFWY